jgi:hypothetical protein
LGCGITKKDTFSSTRVKLIIARTKIMNIANTPKKPLVTRKTGMKKNIIENEERHHLRPRRASD